MPYLLPQPDLKPGHRFDRCVICRRPLIHPRVGRPRRTCSPVCRQRLHRQRFQVYHPDDRAYRRADRRADRQIARLERQFGPLDDTPRSDGLPSFRQRILFLLRRGIPLKRCQSCGRPFIHDVDTGLGLRYCSHRCKARFIHRYKKIRKAIYVLKFGLRISPQVYDRIRRKEPLSFCAHCQIPFVPASSARRPSKYCSRACRQAAYYRRRHPRILGRARCPGCGEMFKRRSPKHTVCSKRCQMRLWRSRRPRPRARTHFWGKCIVCDKEIQNRQRGGPARLYCSHRCNLKAWRMRRKSRIDQARLQPRRCLWCGKGIDPQASLLRRYCDDRCAQHMQVQRALLKRRARPLRPPVGRDCALCGTPFTVRPHAGLRQRFCSHHCWIRAYRASRRAIPAPAIFQPRLPVPRQPARLR